jgi:molybdopterin/thiamine biosynthesis adenylyltransferase
MMDGRWDRLEGLGVEDLREKHVLVVGLGSGGSTVALELAKAGVGRFTLVDPDDLEVANLVRHECDDRYLGWNKAAAVSDLILFRNPGAEVEVVGSDAFSLGEGLREAVAAADLVAGCTDVEPPKHLLNRLCLEAGVPAVYAGVYARGAGGEVMRCGGAPDDACYACITWVLKDATPAPPEEAPDYGADGDRPVPALGIDVRLVALVHAKVCLQTLLGQEAALPGNVLLFGTTAVEELFPRPFASAFVSVAPQDGCLVCGPVRA